MHVHCGVSRGPSTFRPQLVRVVICNTPSLIQRTPHLEPRHIAYRWTTPHTRGLAWGSWVRGMARGGGMTYVKGMPGGMLSFGTMAGRRESGVVTPNVRMPMGL